VRYWDETCLTAGAFRPYRAVTVHLTLRKSALSLRTGTENAAEARSSWEDCTCSRCEAGQSEVGVSMCFPKARVRVFRIEGINQQRVPRAVTVPRSSRD